jgi:two-component system response regulator TctD
VAPNRQTRRSILIVEDDSLLSSALVRVLNRRGHPTVAVGTVADGLAELDGQGFAILDLNLPDGLGTAILERIRADKRPIRVAVATGTSDVALLSEATKLRPDLMLAKPYNMNVLIQWLDSAG